MKRLAVILLLLAGCSKQQVQPPPALPTLPEIQSFRAPPGAIAHPTRYALTWGFEHAMPSQSYEFVIETCAVIGAPWQVFTVTNQPPVLIPTGFYRVATRIKA